jgi:lipid-binding SYLF domain-containing protein
VFIIDGISQEVAVNRPFPTFAALSLFFLTVSCMPAMAQQAEAQRVLDAVDVFQAIIAIPEHEVPSALMKVTSGIAILPGVKRIGFGVGVQRGHGMLLVRGNDGAWSRPLFLTLTGGSIGWQVGIQSADIVLFFRSRDSVERVLRGRYTLGVDASVAAGSLGREAAAATDQDLKAEIYSYSRTRGIFAGFAVQGAALDIDYRANAAYYGKEIDQPGEIWAGTGLSLPDSAAQLQRAIASYEKTLR